MPNSSAADRTSFINVTSAGNARSRGPSHSMPVNHGTATELARFALQSRPMNNVARSTLLCISCAILLISTSCENTQVRTGADESASCRQFAQSFYDWYAPLTQPETKEPASDAVLRRKPDVLSQVLFKALKADSDAQAQAQEIVGIDFDPFVGGQDPAGHYEARRVQWNGNRCSVEVWRGSATEAAEKTGKPDVIAELAQENGRCRFLNFRYPDAGPDLLTMLANLREERRRLNSPGGEGK